MPNYTQIQAQIEKLQKEAESLRKRELAETIANIKKAIAAFGLTAKDLGLAGAQRGAKRGRKPAAKASGAKRRGRPAKSATAAAKAGAKAPAKRGRKAGKKAGKKSPRARGLDKRSVVAPKYRDAASGATWAGRGKQPRWLAAAIKDGKKLSDFLI